MGKKDDGGPAFPSDNYMMEIEHADGSREWHPAAHPGMTLRDWFAGQALCGIASGDMARALAAKQAADGDDQMPVSELMAKHAYLFADAMIAARTS